MLHSHVLIARKRLRTQSPVHENGNLSHNADLGWPEYRGCRVTDDGARVFSICCASAPNAESHTLGTKSLFMAKEKHMEHPTHTHASSPPTPSPHPRPSCSPELRPVMQMRNRCVGGWRAWSRPCFHKDPRLTRSRKSCLPSSSRSKTWILFGPAALHETPAWEPGGREKKKKNTEAETERGKGEE